MIRLQKVLNPALKDDISISESKVYIFKGTRFWMHYFDYIRDHRTLVKAELLKLLKPRLVQSIQTESKPQISIHIRRGDFRDQHPDKNFTYQNSSITRAPLTYFAKIISGIRSVKGFHVPITIFSDGTTDELQEIFSMENIHLHKGSRDIEDLLLMAESKLIVPSPGSTFGLLAAYLSDAIILHHPGFWLRPLRSDEINQKVYEGPVPKHLSEWPKRLIDQIKAIN